MSGALRFRGRVVEGRFAPDEPARYLATLAKLNSKRIEVSVGREKVGRTVRANSFLWGWCYPILSEYTGHTKDEIHHALKCKILGYEDTPLGPMPKRHTRDMSSDEFAEFVHRVQAEAASMGCHIPSPEEVV